MNDIFPPYDRRPTGSLRSRTPTPLPLELFSQAEKRALVGMAVSSAIFTAGGWIAGPAQVPSDVMHRLLADDLAILTEPTEARPSLTARLSPHGMYLARECLKRIPPDVPGKTIVPAR